MAAAVWKFTMSPECVVGMPSGAKVLSVHEQGGAICVWALVDPNAPMIDRHFVVFGTGHEISDLSNLSFIGTAHLHGGSLVFHVFERIKLA